MLVRFRFGLIVFRATVGFDVRGKEWDDLSEMRTQTDCSDERNIPIARLGLLSRVMMLN